MKVIEKYLENMISLDKDVKVKVNVAAAVIVRDIKGEREVLLIQRARDDHWPLHYEFPRGKCRVDEKMSHCLKREIYEETKLKIKPIKYLGKFEYYADKGERKSTQYNFLCELDPPGQEIILSTEHQKYKWVTTAGEIELLVNAGEMKRTLLKALDGDHKLVDYPDDTELEPFDKIEETLKRLWSRR